MDSFGQQVFSSSQGQNGCIYQKWRESVKYSNYLMAVTVHTYVPRKIWKTTQNIFIYF